MDHLESGTLLAALARVLRCGVPVSQGLSLRKASSSILAGHFKTGHPWTGQNRAPGVASETG
jgi:hypothetical protein